MERLSTHQFTTLGSAVLMGTTFFPVAQVTVEKAGRDAWLSILPGFLPTIPLGLILLYLMSKYPNKNLIQITEMILGKWVSKAFGLLYTVICIYFGSLLLIQVADTFQRSVLPRIPAYALLGLSMVLVVMLAWAGIEVFARFSEVVFPLITFGLLISVIFAFPRFEWNELYPILGNGIMPVVWGSVKIVTYPMEYILFLAGLLSFLPTDEKNIKQMKAGVWRAALTVGILNTLVTLIQVFVFGPGELRRLDYSFLSLGKIIEIAKTLAGVESVLMLIWMGAMIIKIGSFLFITLWGVQTVFNLKSKLKWQIGFGISFMVIALVTMGGMFLALELDLVATYFILPFTLLWVFLLWGGHFIRKGVLKQ